MDAVQIAWLAGLYEGEGTAIWLLEPTAEQGFKTTTRVSIAMTDRDVLEKVDQLFPSPSGLHVRQNDAPRKPLWYWSLSRREDVARFLRLVLPHLGQRRSARAREVLAIAEDPTYGTGSGQRRKTHCPSGHPYDEENTANPSGRNRQCKTCRREQDRKRRERKQAQKEAVRC